MLALAVIAAPFTVPAFAAADGGLPEADVPQSVGVQLKGHNFNAATIDAVHDVGFRVVRKGIYWDVVEKEKGRYDFSAFDEQLNHAKRRGLRVVACLFGNNALYEDDGRGGIQTPAGREGFAAFAAAAAARYKDHALLWEVWNEPNVRTFWRKDGTHNSDEFAQEYTDLVQAVAPAMLEADPAAFVLAGSVSNYWQPSYEWTEACFKKGILGSGIRGWSVHPYGVKTPEEFAVGHEKTRALLTRYGAPDMPMVNTERGFAIKNPQGQLELEGWSGGSPARLREHQAAHFVRQFMVDQLHGVALTIWYEWDGEEFGVIGKDPGKDGPRPIETAARFLTRRLDGYRLDRRLETDNQLDYLLIWKDAGGNRQLVAWTAPPPGGTPDEARPHEVSIETNATSAAARFEVADIIGQTATLDALQLTLTGMPQYVTLPAGVELGAITTSAPIAPEPATVAQPAPQGEDLKLFADGGGWTFLKNTGDGLFTVASDGGEPVGVIQYDFTMSQSRSTPYVLAVRPVSVASAQQISLDVRSGIAQQLTFRVIDSTEQTHQFKQRIKGTGQWENVRIPLTRRLEHWGGANDGKVHFPISQIVLSLPLPRDDHKRGQVEYARAIAVGAGAAAPASLATKRPRTATKPAAASPMVPTAGGELKLFEAGAQWKFIKNTGDGSFELADDGGKPVGVLSYNFTKSRARTTPYVLASVPVRIAEGASAVELKVRAARPQRVTLRVTDSTGQTLQFKTSVNGTGGWEAATFPLTRKLEHWDGANDGQVHFPITEFVISIPQPDGEPKIGKIEFTDAAVK
jgi:hypothetical protein